jgi:C-terminal processing protease CtpA/Prc
MGVSTSAERFPTEYVQKESVKILSIQKDFPAEKVSLKMGDEIFKIESKEKTISNVSAENFRKFLKENYNDIKIFYHKENLDGVF